jgi:hypothetical protein
MTGITGRIRFFLKSNKTVAIGKVSQGKPGVGRSLYSEDRDRLLASNPNR